MKKCSNCGKVKSRDRFYKDKARKDGLTFQCKKCIRVHKQSNRGKQVRNKACKKHRQTIKGYLCHCFSNMNLRCNNPEAKDYARYGGKGVKNLFKSFDEFFHHITIDLGFDTYNKIKGLQIDRVNTNGHYEISNLRIVTQSQNTMNSCKHSHHRGRLCSSHFKGVSWNKRRKKWCVCITVNGKTHHLGYFTDEIKAAEAYDRAAIRLHGKHGFTNRMLGLLD